MSRGIAKNSKKSLQRKVMPDISRKDTIVAVRMPKGLVEELRDLQKINHFMDISDEIRYIVRKYCLAAQKPQESLSRTLSQSGFIEQKKREKLIEELDAVLKTLKQNAGQETQDAQQGATEK